MSSPQSIRMQYITTKLIADRIAKDTNISAEQQTAVDAARIDAMDLLTIHKVPNSVIDIWDREADLLASDPGLWLMYFGYEV